MGLTVILYPDNLTINSSRSSRQILKSQLFTTLGKKDIRIRKLKFQASYHLLRRNREY